MRGPAGPRSAPNCTPFYPALAAAGRPATVEAWLNKSAPAIVRELAGKELTHRALDELPVGKTVEHLRSVLVATGRCRNATSR